MAHTHPECLRCQLPLRRRNDPVFRGTVLAKGSHNCQAAQKVLTQAASGAAMFAGNRGFVQARYISPILTARAWIGVLQERTTTHGLTHHILPVPGGGSFVVSHREDAQPDMREVYAQLYDQIAALGTSTAPDRIVTTWESGRKDTLQTTAGQPVS
jgi:putative heme degradation protein